MHNVHVQVRVHDRATKVIGTRNVVVNGVALGLGVLHRIWGLWSASLFLFEWLHNLNDEY